MQAFEDLIDVLSSEFCNNPKLGPGVAVFGGVGKKIAARDASDFVSGFKAGLVKPHKKGQYRAAQSCASEQFFWSGSKKKEPRSVTLWVEPIIAVAALWRLHSQYEWPVEHLGTQSKRWGFDVCTYERPSPPTEPATSPMVIACEIKKTTKELDEMVMLMKKFISDPPPQDELKFSKEVNAFRKVEELRLLKPRYFWAVGPGGYNMTFRIAFHNDGAIVFADASGADLQFPGLIRQESTDRGSQPFT